MDEVVCCSVCHEPVNTSKVYDLRDDMVMHPECVAHYLYTVQQKRKAEPHGSDPV